MSEVLKPCPFCGGKATLCLGRNINYSTPMRFWYVMCLGCYSRGEYFYESTQELAPQDEADAIRGAWDFATKAWNRRVSELVKECGKDD